MTTKDVSIDVLIKARRDFMSNPVLARRELVTMAYGDCQTPPLAARCLNFKTERVSLAEAIDLCEVIGGYNKFDPQSVRDLLGEFAGEDVTVEVGREGSPVLYIFARSQDVRTKILFALTSYADELTEEPGGTIRAWWD